MKLYIFFKQFHAQMCLNKSYILFRGKDWIAAAHILFVVTWQLAKIENIQKIYIELKREVIYRRADIMLLK